MSERMREGGKVSHRLYGKGRIIQEWGCWASCRKCFAEMHGMKCSYCGQVYGPDAAPPHTKPLHMSGRGVFEVKFSDGKTRAINKMWLQGIPE